MTDPRLVRMDAEDAEAIRSGDPHGQARVATKLLRAYSEGITEEEAETLASWASVGIAETCPPDQSPKPGYGLVAKLTQEDE